MVAGRAVVRDRSLQHVSDVVEFVAGRLRLREHSLAACDRPGNRYSGSRWVPARQPPRQSSFPSLPEARDDRPTEARSPRPRSTCKHRSRNTPARSARPNFSRSGGENCSCGHSLPADRACWECSWSTLISRRCAQKPLWMVTACTGIFRSLACGDLRKILDPLIFPGSPARPGSGRFVRCRSRFQIPLCWPQRVDPLEVMQDWQP